MRFILALFLCAPALGVQFPNSILRDASSTTIPTAYATAGGELVSVGGNRAMCLENQSGAVVLVCLADSASDCSVDNWRLKDGGSICIDNIRLTSSFAKVFIKAEGSAITSGHFQAIFWR